MHPEIQQEKPGMCPECGMALVPERRRKASRPDSPAEHGEHGEHGGKDSVDFDKHSGHQTASFLTKFWIAVALSIPIIAYSELAERFFGFAAQRFSGFEYLSLILGSVIFFYCGWIFISSAFRELRVRLPGMMTLIALAISTAYLWSVYATITKAGHTLWWELSTLIAIMLLGHWVEMRAVQGAKGALKELMKLLPDTAEVIRNGTPVKVSLKELKTGDMLLIRPGAKIPADGKIVEGRSDIDESIITGESRPVGKGIGEEVIAGSINGDGGLTVEVTKIGEQTFLAGVMRLVRDAEASKSRLQMLSDRAAFYLTIIAVVAGSVTFLTWFFMGAGASVAVERLVAVLVIACPHALGLAIPLVASISTTMAARNGLLVRKRLALEAARNITTVLFDKTGTLTEGKFGVYAVVPAPGETEESLLRLAASVNSRSEHPLAHALVEDAKKKGIRLAEVLNFERVPGKGAQGEIGGQKISVGNDSLARDASASFPQDIAVRIRELSWEGKTVIHVIRESTLAGSIALADVIRPESREAISYLKKEGIKVAMMTGDSKDVASWVAKELGLDQYFAEVLPGEKANKVQELQSVGERVAMVGDGVNDAPALTQADLGIAIGAGTNVAIESAGIILVKSDPRDIPKIIRLSKLTYSKMIQNLFWATAYNLAALPLAAGVLAFKGIILEPAVAAVFMSLSTVIVSINAVLLRRRAL